MVGLTFAAVPLYSLFCRTTGYAGTPRRVTAGAEHTVDRDVVVRFDGNVQGLPWALPAREAAGDAEARRDRLK